MLPGLFLLAGGAVSLYCLWQLGRWLREGTEAPPARDASRLEALVDELVATAEATVTMIQDRSEALSDVIAEADRRLALLTAVPAPAPVAVNEPEPAGPEVEPGRELHAQVYRLLDGGQDVTAVARQLGLTKGEVLLIQGLRQPSRSL